MNLGIMGGTFDPVHYGHLIAAQEARFSFGLDEVLFIPNRTPPHKMHNSEIADAEDRYAMTCLATFSNPFFRVSRLEIDRTSISYTSETIKTLRGLFPHDELFLINGADGLIRYEWHDFDRLIDMLYCFVVVSRPGFSLEDLADSCRKLSERHRHKIKYLEIPCLEISSTDIRKRLGEGKPITYMVPEEVEKYIFKHGLYIG